MRNLRMVCCIAAASAVAAVAASAAATTYSPEDEALYMKRFNATGQNAQDTYDTLEAVPGAPGAKPLPDKGPHAISPDALKAATDYAAKNNSTAFIVWQGGKVETASYFEGTKPDAPQISRSLAKPLASIAVGRAIALGKIKSVDQPVADYVKEWRGTPKGEITIRQILTMTAGLLPQAFSNDPNNIWSRAYLHPRHDQIMIHDYPLSQSPGTVYGYSNVAGDMSALIIERATGRRYGEFLSDEVLKPIGAMGGQIWVDRPGGLAHSGCCILLPADDWLRLGILLAQDGVWGGKRLLAAGYVKTMQEGSRPNPFYGLGVYVYPHYVERRGFFSAPPVGKEHLAHPEPFGAKDGVLHSEPFAAPDLFMFDGNANQAVWIVPSKKLVIVRLGKAPPKAPEWDNSIIPNIIIRGMAH